MPKISVVMPVFNGDDFLELAIKSVLAQTYNNFEFIIINDGSTDNSLEIIRKFSDNRIKLITNDQNLGIIKTLNKGMKLSQGDYIVRMDSDDICHPNRFEKQLRYMENHKDVAICGTWINEINEKGKNLRTKSYSTDSIQLKYELLFSNVLAHPSIIIRKNIFDLNEFYYDENYIHAEDFELWNRLSKKYRIANIPETLLNYRISKNGISRKKRQEQLVTGSKIIERIFCINNIKVEKTYFSSCNLNYQELLCIEKKMVELKEKLKKQDKNNINIIDNIFSNEWFKYSNRATNNGMKVVTKYLNSDLNTKKQFKLYKLKFLLKCIIKYKSNTV
jgi:glycosyltransferase involved in cell wall biosynthesis